MTGRMVRVRLLVDRGTVGGYQAAGDVIEVSDLEAERLFASEVAEPISDTAPESAMLEAPRERATRPRPRSRHRRH